MKRLAILWVAAGTAVCPASAQLFGPESLTGGLFGAFIGGMAGADCHHGFSGEGAAIGAGVGLLAGALVGEANRRSAAHYGYGPVSYGPGYVYQPAALPAVQPGYGYVETPAYVPAPVMYAPPPPRPNYTVGGTLTGALAGGLIGASQGHGWEGAGIGAAAGLVVGGVAESAARKQEQRAWTAAQQQAYTPSVPVAQQALPTQSLQQPAPAQPQVSAPPAAPVYWAAATPPPPAIPDAPRVPDAPTF